MSIAAATTLNPAREIQEITVTLEQENSFEFRVKFDWVENNPLITDEPASLGKGKGRSSSFAAGGFSALGAALYSIGIPKDGIIEYETQMKARKFVIVTHGSQDEVSKTRAALTPTKHQSMREHSCCVVREFMKMGVQRSKVRTRIERSQTIHGQDSEETVYRCRQNGKQDS
jgi:hypothetical protein